MEKIRQLEKTMRRSERLPLFVIALSLFVLAGVVTLAAFQARARIREQIAGRDGEVLHAVALLQHAQDVEDGVADDTMTAGDQLNVALRSSKLRGVLGVRLFDPKGEFVESFPLYVIEQDRADVDLEKLKNFRAVSRFHPAAEMAGLFYPDDTAPTGKIPLLEVFVPLHTENGPLAGIAQFLVEGHSIAAEYARLDRLLLTRTLLVFCAGGTILTLALLWAFRRVRRAQRLLTARTEDLVRANQELALAAKTSALGAVAAHLIHGLKNPLAGLQNFVVSRSATPDGEESDWAQAAASTRRMQAMINQVTGVLSEEQSGATYEITFVELEQLVRNRVQSLARERGVGFTTLIQTEGALPNRVANLVALVLVNLCENAIQATPPEKAVSLIIRREDGRLIFEVRDEGPGFPADTPLFMPCRSVKEGGSGIGLALCKQLANHLGAELDLMASTSAGCVFALRLTAESREVKPKSQLTRL